MVGRKDQVGALADVQTFFQVVSCGLQFLGFGHEQVRSDDATVADDVHFVFAKMPEGMERSTNFWPSKMMVCPAFGPPAKRATTSYSGVNTSTTFPLPSSPKNDA